MRTTVAPHDPLTVSLLSSPTLPAEYRFTIPAMDAGNRILGRMLERLFAAITSGPSLNCRPHASRQRIDLSHLVKLGDADPGAVLRDLLGDSGASEVVSKLVAPARQPTRWRARGRDASVDDQETDQPQLTPEEQAAQRAWAEHQALLTKLRVVVDEARTYENDTGAYVLNVGFPLVSIPPGLVSGRGSSVSRRVLAPIAFIPVSITVKSGASPSVVIECKSDEVDRVIPNDALLAWLEQQTRVKPPETAFTDEEGAQPWREIAELVRHVAGALKIDLPPLYGTDALPELIILEAAPKTESLEGKATIIPAAVLGLFPMANQGLLRDTQAMLEGEAIKGPVESFLRVDVSLDQPPADQSSALQAQAAPPTPGKRPKAFASERLVALADPCQSRAVALARSTAGLVIHGPPGTGKSQTITNVIGDHLSRGERVLFVCDKRTALDVVANRLEHLGLGSLCALIHDPQRDQRDLYMAIRNQLETLQEVKTHPQAQNRTGKIDDELAAVHAELTDVHHSLSRPPVGEESSLHELLGQWLALAPAIATGQDPGTELAPESVREVSPADLERAGPIIRETLKRALDVGYTENPWAAAAAISLTDLVSRPMDHFRSLLGTCLRDAQAADEASDERVPPFAHDIPLGQQVSAREQLLGLVETALRESPGETRSLWAGRAEADISRAHRSLVDAGAMVTAFRGAPLDAELLAVVQAQPPSAAELAVRLGALEAYLPTARAWWGFLAIGRKSRAAKVLEPLGLGLNAGAAERARGFFAALRAAMVLRAMVDQFEGRPTAGQVPQHEPLDAALKAHSGALSALSAVYEQPSLRPLAPLVIAKLAAQAGSGAGEALLEGLRRSRKRAEAIQKLEGSIAASSLFTSEWVAGAHAAWCAGGAQGLAAPIVSRLNEQLRTLEDVARIREALGSLSRPLAQAMQSLLKTSAAPDAGLATIRRSVLAAEITRRLTANPKLQGLDSRRLQGLFDRYRELEDDKRTKVRDAILHRWVTLQKERLLASTGSRLSTAGADVRRRLTTRGKHAMRLRQVLALGRNMEGGDPLMDLRPIWMASPETVAQIFPRQPVFDVVIFDEASQCRLEEALPVLTRGKRVVIAGDPKQLPPTRFFETAVAQSEVEEIESDQQLFESQQQEVEDLLGAALGLDIEQSYLDVHYRSRNADLIAFSNDNFYGNRLQPIPGHPRNRARYAPLTMYRVAGVYDKRTNEAEAEQVCRIVHDLLRRAEPPSIGIGCFNLAQRDLILEKLEELAQQDAAFGRALAVARTRRGAAAFEGLFVKNLENVQGDERDHIIISTTYGPDKEGKFYRRFGPLAMPGGGRRLNVLVTRARNEVHVVTSIPREVYTALPPVPTGQTPTGGWLLFAYLSFAERLAGTYEAVHKAVDGEGAERDAAPAPATAPLAATLPAPKEIIEEQTRTPSPFASALAKTLAAHDTGSIVHWGNDGFCVDVAVRHPSRAEDVTVGVLCDMTRYTLADDQVEWDIFRTGVLESQGWKLQRLWSPIFFRDPKGQMEEIMNGAMKAAGS